MGQNPSARQFLQLLSSRRKNLLWLLKKVRNVLPEESLPIYLQAASASLLFVHSPFCWIRNNSALYHNLKGSQKVCEKLLLQSKYLPRPCGREQQGHFRQQPLQSSARALMSDKTRLKARRNPSGHVQQCILPAAAGIFPTIKVDVFCLIKQ